MARYTNPGSNFMQGAAPLPSNNVADGNQSNIRSDYYLVVGTELLNQETDEMEFISLPQPVYLDQMKKKQVSGEGSFQEMICKQNDLLDSLLNYAKEHLAPGDCEELQFSVRLYRRKPSQEDSHKKVVFEFKTKKIK